MRIRDLTENDAALMLEWMHDPFVVENMKTDFQSKTIDDCKTFIESSQLTSDTVHLAIADDNDEYMGTVSLKHIIDGKAEFGITVRKCAMGKGYSKYGMEQIIEKGFTEFNLKEIYWCVDPSNKRAISFYNKNKYNRCKCPEYVFGYTDVEKNTFYWYHVTVEEFRG